MKNKIKYYQMFESKDKTNVVIFEVINKFNYLIKFILIIISSDYS